MCTKRYLSIMKLKIIEFNEHDSPKVVNKNLYVAALMIVYCVNLYVNQLNSVYFGIVYVDRHCFEFVLQGWGCFTLEIKVDTYRKY